MIDLKQMIFSLSETKYNNNLFVSIGFMKWFQIILLLKGQLHQYLVEIMQHYVLCVLRLICSA